DPGAVRGGRREGRARALPGERPEALPDARAQAAEGLGQRPPDAGRVHGGRRRRRDPVAALRRRADGQRPRWAASERGRPGAVLRLALVHRARVHARRRPRVRQQRRVRYLREPPHAARPPRRPRRGPARPAQPGHRDVGVRARPARPALRPHEGLMPEPDERATAAPGALAAGPTPPHRSLWQDVFRTGFSLRFVAAGGVPPRVLEAGDGPPLLLLHGTGGHLEAFMRNVSALAERFRVIVCDMVGHGFSGKPDVPYTVDYLSDHVVALLDALGIERAHISGESLGGWVAAWVAAHHPERVDRLILNTPGNVAARPEVMARIKESSLKAVAEADRANVRARLEWLFHDKSQVTDELVDVRLAIYAQPGFLRTMENI